MLEIFCKRKLSGPIRIQTELARFTSVNPNWHLGPRRIAEHLLYLVFSGRCRVSAEGQTYRLEAGDLIWIPPGTEHECRVFPDVPMALHHLRFRLWDGAQEITDLGGVHHLLGVEELRPWLIAWIKEFSYDSPWRSTRILALFTVIATQIQELTHREETVERSFTRQQRLLVEQMVDSNMELRLTAHDLAAELALSTTYFRQLFRQTYGQAVRSWLIHRRIRQAAVMLTESGMTVSATAYALGYESLSLFSRQFSDSYAMSPRAYKASRG